MRNFLRDKSGIAATEFALILPFLVMVFMSVYEMAFRFQISDEMERYTYQLGDFLSRSDGLTDTNITEIYDFSDELMPSVDFNTGSVSFLIVSVGYNVDGDPLLLWKRSRGDEELEYDIENARGLAEPGQSVLVALVKLQAKTMFSVLGDTNMNKTSVSVFKPRTTRAIAINGDLTDVGDTVEGYEHD